MLWVELNRLDLFVGCMYKYVNRVQYHKVFKFISDLNVLCSSKDWHKSTIRRHRLRHSWSYEFLRKKGFCLISAWVSLLQYSVFWPQTLIFIYTLSQNINNSWTFRKDYFAWQSTNLTKINVNCIVNLLFRGELISACSQKSLDEEKRNRPKEEINNPFLWRKGTRKLAGNDKGS